MATSKYPDDIAQDFETEEKLFDFIDDEIPTQQSNAIRGQNIRNTLKSLFKTLLPSSEKEYEYDMTIVHVQSQQVSMNDFVLRTIGYNSDKHIVDIIYKKLKECKYYKIFPKLANNRASNFYAAPYTEYNISLDIENSNFKSTEIDIPIVSGLSSSLIDFVLVISKDEIPIEIKKCQNKYDESDTNEYEFLSLNINSDADSIKFNITNTISFYDDFYSLVLSYMKFNDNAVVKNGKKIKLCFNGNTEFSNTIVQSTTGEDYCTSHQKSHIYNSNGELVDLNPEDLDLSNTYYVKDIEDNRYEILSVSSSVPYTMTIDNQEQTQKGIKAYGDIKNVKYHFAPDIFIMPPYAKDNTSYLYNTKATYNGTALSVYEFDSPIMDEDYSLNGVYSMSGYNYFTNSGTTYGIKDTYLEFTYWNKKWFFNGINR